MTRHASQSEVYLEEIRKYIELDINEDSILLIVDNVFKKAREKNVPIDVLHKFPDCQTVAGIAEKKKFNKIIALFLEKGTGTSKPDTQSSPTKKRKITPNDGKTSNVVKNTHSAAILTTSSKQNENTGLKSFLHGIAYQLKLILIIFAHAYQLKKNKNNFECTVSTEDPEAGKFDDIVYKYSYPGEFNTVYIQAKHKKHPYCIVKNDLTTSSNDSPFALVPYFSSFLDLKLLNNSNTKDLILTTNATLHETLLPIVEKSKRSRAAEIDTFLAAISDPDSDQQATCYRLNWEKLKSDREFEPLIEKLKGCSNSNRLAKLLAEHIHGKKKLTQRTPLFKANGAAIITDIVGKAKNKGLGQYYINNNFLTPNAQTRQNVKYFRDIFEAEYKKLSNGIDVWQDVALKGISITSGFMNLTTSNPPNLPNDEVTDNILEEFFNVFVLVCNTVNEEALTKRVVERWENSIVSQLCNSQLSPIASENACAVMTEYVFDWISRNGDKINESDIEIFYEQLFYKIQLLQLQGVTDNRLQELKQLNIEVERQVLRERCFYRHLWPKTKSDDLLLYRSHFDTSLVAAIVMQTLTIPQEKKDEYEYIFLDDRNYQRMKPVMEGIFHYLPVNIALIVECKNETNTASLVESSEKMSQDTPESFLKKMIFIERIGIEQRPTNSELFLIRHLTKRSRESSYEQHKNMQFFGANVKLEDIVENDDDLMYLFQLTKTQSLSGSIVEQRYSKIQTWYIERTIKTGRIRYTMKKARYRTRAEMKKFSSGSLGLSTFCKELTNQLENANNLLMKRFDDGKIIQNLRQQAARGTKPQCNPKKKIHIIVDEPGIGKTTYLTWLAKELQTENSTNWIIPFTSIEYATDFARMCQNMGHINPTVALRFFFELLYLAWYVPKINRQTIEETDPVREKAERCASLLDFTSGNQHVLINEDEARMLGTQQLAHLRIFKKKYNDSKMVILFDGFDEIAPHYKEIVLALFSHYDNMSGIARIYLTSRPNLFEKEFEEHFNQPEFYHLEPFSERDQIVFLDTFLRRMLREYATLQGKQDGYELLCVLHNVTDELLGDQKQIPLFMSVSSELLLPLIQTHISFTPEIIVSTDLVEEAKILFEPQNMIERFIDRKLYILNVEKTGTTDAAYNIPATQLNAEELNTVKYRKHILLALYAMCGQDELNRLLEQNEQTEALQYMMQVQFGKEKSGIVEAFNDNVPQFIHRTIPECLMARWIFNNRREEKVRAYLHSEQYWHAKYGKRVVRDYLNRMLAYGSPIHQAVINQHTLEVIKITKKDPKAASTLDAGGRTPLHLASEFGNLLQHRHTMFRELFEKLLESSPESVDNIDDLFNWRPIDYALRSNSLQAIEMLIEHGVKIDPDVLANQILCHSTDLYEILHRTASYEGLLYTKNGRYQKQVAQTCRQVADNLFKQDNFNLHVPTGEDNITPIKLCTDRDAPELLKSLLLAKNSIEIAFDKNNFGILDFLVTSKHDLPTNCTVREKDLELCLERGYTRLFGILFQRHCEQENLPYDPDFDGHHHEKDDAGEKINNWGYFNEEAHGLYEASKYKTKKLKLLSVAVNNGNFDIVRCMIEKAKLVINNDIVKYLILKAAWFPLITHRRFVPICRYLLQTTEDILAVDDKGRTLLHYFARVGYVYMVKYLIEEKGFLPQTVSDKNGWNAFHYCVSMHIMSDESKPNFCTIFRYMMEKARADDIHAFGFDGNNVLYVAVENRHFREGKLIVASVLENVTAPNDQQVLMVYFEASNLSNNQHFGDFLNFLIADEQGDLSDVFRSVKEQLHI